MKTLNGFNKTHTHIHTHSSEEITSFDHLLKSCFVHCSLGNPHVLVPCWRLVTLIKIAHSKSKSLLISHLFIECENSTRFVHFRYQPNTLHSHAHENENSSASVHLFRNTKNNIMCKQCGGPSTVFLSFSFSFGTWKSSKIRRVTNSWCFATQLNLACFRQDIKSSLNRNF